MGKRSGSDRLSIIQRRELVWELTYQDVNARQISKRLHVSYKTILRDVAAIRDQKAEESANRVDIIYQEALDRKRWEYQQLLQLYYQPPRRHLLKYQDVEEVNGRKMVVEKTRWIEENDRFWKLRVLMAIRVVSNDINRLQGLLTTQSLERLHSSRVDVGRGVIYERPPLNPEDHVD